MNRFLVGLFLIFSIGVFASDSPFEMQEKILENHLKMNYRTFTDGKITLDNIDYDIDIYRNGAIVELELETMRGDGGWEKFNKKVFKRLMTEISNKVKKDRDNSKFPINIIFKIEKQIGEDIIVYNKIF